jgi:glycosyltransferase involved in cell wall biosynthesis
VPPGDARVLAAALDCMLRDPAAANELGARAARRAAAEYDESRMVSRWAALYEQVLADARPRAPAAAHVRIGSA